MFLFIVERKNFLTTLSECEMDQQIQSTFHLLHPHYHRERYAVLLISMKLSSQKQNETKVNAMVYAKQV